MGTGPEKSGVIVSEIMKDKLYFAPLNRPEDSAIVHRLPKPASGFNIDNELVYEPFFADFGPLNLACTYRFCWKLHGLLKEADEQNQCVFFWCSAEPKKKSNAAVLVGAYLVLFNGVEAEAAYETLSRFQPFMPFRDPTCGISTYHLSVYDCIQAISKAQKLDWIDFNNFRLDEYEYFEQVKNGDLNWMVPGKLVAFSGPSARRLEIYGYRTLVPEDYVEYFQRVGVSGIIRLNRRVYERRRFTDHGLSHHDLYFPDGSCPPERIVKRFLEIVEGTSGALAVHCKAGLGRTGVLIGCYIMKHYKFTCNEALGYLRIVRPGSVIGPQQHFLRDIQVRMWKAGDAMRNQKVVRNMNSCQVFPKSVQDTVVPILPNQPGSVTGVPSPSSTPNAGGAAWTQGNNNLLASKKYTGNPVLGRDNAQDREIHGTSGFGQNWKGGVARLQDHTTPRSPPQQLKISALRDETSEDEGPGSIRAGESRLFFVPTPAQDRFSQLGGQRAGKAVNIETSLGGLSINSTCQPSSSYLSTKSIFHSSPYNSRLPLNNSIRRLSSYRIASVHNPGILRNATGAVSKVPAGGGVIVQRLLNAAGQPRKVVMPVGQERAAPPSQPLTKRRENSLSHNLTPASKSLQYGS